MNFEFVLWLPAAENMPFHKSCHKFRGNIMLSGLQLQGGVPNAQYLKVNENDIKVCLACKSASAEGDHNMYLSGN